LTNLFSVLVEAMREGASGIEIRSEGRHRKQVWWRAAVCRRRIISAAAGLV